MAAPTKTIHKVNDYQAGLELTKDINEILTGLENVTVISTSHTVLQSDQNIVAVDLSAATTVTLPALAETKTGKIFTICNTDTATATTIARQSTEKINGSTANKTLEAGRMGISNLHESIRHLWMVNEKCF
jgi:hypothetical protein